ncbi:A kinase (PRKA) anchor protein 1b [Austrofundulus limnaeus]|uniref:A kinase (PRKA) anchor protein 1b n=1 Tax=Austrofundulus limnaeus TaxID=52670 RepID=A0A2I4D3I3_AUSLI|nr:PREDICTED: A-kinase anchor protein 1, mitochondrial [Austrofundulus limnaeus]
MHLRFRSVVPYTLPGVLALIGWWWYTSRKKERFISQVVSEGPPSAESNKTIQTEDRNGLVEKDNGLSPLEEDMPNRRPQKLSNKGTEQELISQIHIQDTEASPSSAKLCEDASNFSVRNQGEEVNKSSNFALLSSNKEDMSEDLRENPKDPDKGSSLVPIRQLEEHLDKDSANASEALEVKQSSHSTKAIISSSTAAHLSDAERPEPEGEVATHQNTAQTQEEMAVTTTKECRVVQSEADSLESPLSADLHKRILTSTPTALTFPVQDSSTPWQTSEDIQIERSTPEEHNLELLAAGLITEVISAATQEVLGVTSCKVTQKNQVSTSSCVLLASEKPCSHEEPIQQHSWHLRDCGEVAERPGVSKSSSIAAAELTDRVQETNGAQSSSRPTQVTTVLTTKRRRNEDSVCSTCPSEDGVSSEGLQSIVSESQADLAQVSDLSPREAVQLESLVETMTKAAEEDSVCVLRRPNGIGSRDGAHQTCEVDTDQSGGSDVNSMDSVDSGCTMSASEHQANCATSSNSELVIWEIEVPKHLVGRLIGRQGRYVSFLKQSSGAKIYISTLPYTQEFQICHIEGVQQQVDKALSLIGKKFKDLDLTNLYAPPPPPLTLPSLPITSWLLLPSGVTVEVIVVNIVSAGHIFVQQHTHPTYHALRSLDQQMFLCYSQPGTPALPSPAEVGVICAAPAVEGAWWRAQVITFYKDTDEVEIRYVDYGGYDRVKMDSLRQIRSDFVTLPFQGAEVLLDNITPLPGEDRFTAEATSALEEMTRGVPLLAQVSNYDNNTGLPLIHLWNMVGEEVISVNRTLAERNLAVWVDGF